MPVVAPEATRTVPDRMCAIEMTSHEDVQPGTGAAARLLGELERDALGRDHVVAADDALVFDAENALEVDAARGDKGRGGIRRRTAELGVERREEVLAQVAIGRGDGGDAGDAPLVDEAILQRAIDPLTAAAGSGRVGENVLDAEPREGPAHLREPAAIGRAACRRGVGGPARAIRV